MNKLCCISSVLIDPYRERQKISRTVSCLVSVATGIIFLGSPHALAAAYRYHHKDTVEPNLTQQKIAKFFKSNKKPKENPEDSYRFENKSSGTSDLRTEQEEKEESLEYHDKLEFEVEWVIKPPENFLVSKLKSKIEGRVANSKEVLFTKSPPLTKEYIVENEDDERDPTKKVHYHQKKKIMEPIPTSEKTPLSNSLQMWEKEHINKRDLTRRKSISSFPDLYAQQCQQRKHIADQIIANKETLCKSIDDYYKLQQFCDEHKTTMEKLIATEDSFKSLLKSDRIRRMIFTHYKKEYQGNPQSEHSNFYCIIAERILDYSVSVTICKLELFLSKVQKNLELVHGLEITSKNETLRIIKQAFPGTKEQFFCHNRAQRWLQTDKGVRINSIVFDDGASSFGNERSSFEYQSCSSDGSSSEYLSCSSGGERSSSENLSFSSEPVRSSSETLNTKAIEQSTV